MPGYVGTLLDIHDQERFRDYLRGVGPSLAKHGGRIALRGPVAGVVEGTLDTREDTRLVMIEFDSLEAARAWYQSDEYQQLIKLREAPVATTTAFLIDGIDLETRPGKMSLQTAQGILDQVMAWPGVTSHEHQFGGVEFRLGNRQLGHLHGDRTADIPIKRALRDQLIASGRARVHRWRPDSGWVTVDLDSGEGRAEAVRLLRIGYEGALRARSRRER